MCDLETKRNLVVALHLEGKSNIEIRRELPKLKLNDKFIHRTIQRYNETGSIKKRYGGGRRCTATTTANVQKVRCRLRRNPERSANQLAKDLDVSDRSMRRILKTKLNVRPLKKNKSQELTLLQRQKRLNRSKELIRLLDCGQLPNLVFSDESTFCVEQHLNRQNDRVWLKGRVSDHSEDLRVTRRQGAAQVMVWAAVHENGRSPLVFLPMGPKGVKINQQVYREQVLEAYLIPWAQNEFGSEPWTFQQDSAPSHKAIATQSFLRNNVPHFISTDLWPPSSPDLNPLDFSIWGILKAKACSKKHSSLEALKQTLTREWNRISQNVIRAACMAFRKRLSLVVKAKGGNIPAE